MFFASVPLFSSELAMFVFLKYLIIAYGKCGLQLEEKMRLILLFFSPWHLWRAFYPGRSGSSRGKTVYDLIKGTVPQDLDWKKTCNTFGQWHLNNEGLRICILFIAIADSNDVLQLLQKSWIRIWIGDSECRILLQIFYVIFALFVQKSVHFSYGVSSFLKSLRLLFLNSVEWLIDTVWLCNTERMHATRIILALKETVAWDGLFVHSILSRVQRRIVLIFVQN